jgi:hypothetical protein
MNDIWAELIIGVLTACGTVWGVVSANNKHDAVTDVKLDTLTEEVRKHNNFAQRVPVIEEQIKTANHRIDDLEKKTMNL